MEFFFSQRKKCNNTSRNRSRSSSPMSNNDNNHDNRSSTKNTTIATTNTVITGSTITTGTCTTCNDNSSCSNNDCYVHNNSITRKRHHRGGYYYYYYYNRFINNRIIDQIQQVLIRIQVLFLTRRRRMKKYHLYYYKFVIIILLFCSIIVFLQSLVLFNNNNNNNIQYYYSIARLDQSGATIHDMMLAHAYIYSMNYNNKNNTNTNTNNNIIYKYGGACLHYIPFYPRRDCVRLLRDIGWSKQLQFACPSRKQQSNTILSEDIYRKHDGTLFTKEWKKEFIKEINKIKKHNNHDIDDNDNNNVYNIVVHIRRGDVNPCHYPNRYLPNIYYQKLIDKYAKNYSNNTINNNKKNVQVTIYSESNSYEPLDEFINNIMNYNNNNQNKQKYNVTIQIDTSLSIVWDAIINADVVILSKSSFSYVPAILNTNTVIYTPFWHQPLNTWITVDDEDFHNITQQQQLKQIACQIIPPKQRGFYKRKILPIIRNILQKKGGEKRKTKAKIR